MGVFTMEWLRDNLGTVLFLALIVIFMSKNKILGLVFKVKNISVHELKEKMKTTENLVLIDVRSESEFNSYRIKEAKLVPLNTLGSKVAELKEKFKNNEIAVICQAGGRSAVGAMNLKRAGLETVYNVQGGMGAWMTENYPTLR